MEFRGIEVMLMQGKLTHIALFGEAHLHDMNYYRWLTDMDVVRYIGREEYLSKISFSAVQKYVKEMWDSEFCTFLAVYHSESGRFIGTAKINFMNERGRKNGLADIGIMIGERDFWGKGLAKDILRSVSRFAFENLGARKLTAGAMSPNIAVIRAFQTIGFVVEGVLRQQLATPGGEGYCDHVLLGCMRSELVEA
jgi:RimJ/RimL family protein N-acetyltransferase